MDLHEKLKEFKEKGSVLIPTEKVHEFRILLKLKNLCFYGEDVDEGIVFYHGQKLSQHVKREIAPGVKEIDVMGLFSALSRR